MPDDQLTPQPAANEPQKSSDELQPGAGKPLVEGAPMSVSEPVEASTINRFAALAGIGLLALAVVVILVVLVVLLGVCATHR